jgi:excisionase family DNA binding protein
MGWPMSDLFDRADTADDVLRKAAAEPWLTVDEVARLWRIPRRTVYHLIDKGALKAQRFGRHVRVRSQSVLRLNTGLPTVQK